MSNPITGVSTAVGAATGTADVLPLCPLCHTLDRTITAEALRDGAEWSCGRCGQRWGAAQLATAAAYAQYEATH